MEKLWVRDGPLFWLFGCSLKLEIGAEGASMISNVEAVFENVRSVDVV